MNKTYTINDLSLISGLTTRSLRNYIKDGLLKGDKPDGNWAFTDRQITEFLSHPSVKPSIQAKNKAIVFDFLSDEDKKEHASCVILDYVMETHHANHLCAVLCKSINETSYQHVRFSFEYKKRTARITLSGPESFIIEMMNLASETCKKL